MLKQQLCMITALHWEMFTCACKSGWLCAADRFITYIHHSLVRTLTEKITTEQHDSSNMLKYSHYEYVNTTHQNDSEKRVAKELVKSSARTC